MKNILKKIFKYIVIILFLIIIILLILFYPRNYGNIDNSKIDDDNYFRLMTYNIKNSYQDYDSWINRRSEIIKLINDYSPDIIGMQEVDNDWLPYLIDNLKDYDYYAMGREPDSYYNEYNAIFYLKDRFEVIDKKTFWLSKTPNEVSRGWGAACNRIASNITFKDNNTNEIFIYYNTHLDHESKLARENGYELIYNKILENNYPSILSGDFNSIEWSNLYKNIKKNLDDTKYIANDSMSFGTMNYFTNFYFRFVPPVDYIFTTKNDFEVNRYAVIPDYKYDGKPISDHFPIFVDLKLK